MMMRELSTLEIGGVSGGTNIFDYRSGTPGSGLANDPLNTGNVHIDLANAFALVGTGELSASQLNNIRPDLYQVYMTETTGIDGPVFCFGTNPDGSDNLTSGWCPPPDAGPDENAEYWQAIMDIFIDLFPLGRVGP